MATNTANTATAADLPTDHVTRACVIATMVTEAGHRYLPPIAVNLRSQYNADRLRDNGLHHAKRQSELSGADPTAAKPADQ